MILLTIVPTLTVSLLLGFYFISMRFSDLDKNLYTRGDAITTELISMAEYGLYSHNSSLLQNITDSVLSYADVQSAAIYNAKGELLSFTGAYPKLKPDYFDSLLNDLGKNIHAKRQENTVLFVAPVRLNELHFNDHQLLSLNKKPSGNDDTPIGWIAVSINRDSTVVSQYQAIIATFLIVLIGLVISILFGLRLGGDLINPLLSIINAVRRIRDGDLDTHVQTNPPGELKILEGGINKMTTNLRNSRDEMQVSIEQATADLRQTLETIEIQNIELDIARKEAIAASQVKSHFLANMSHEIRTPINGIIGFLDLLRRSQLDGTQQEYVTTIEQSSKQLLEIINDILDFSKIEAGNLKLEERRFNLVDVIENSIMLFRPQVIVKEIDFDLYIDPDLPEFVIGDELRVSQIFMNLVGNALKFTEKGGVSVQVMTASVNHDILTVKARIKDTGIGLSLQQKRNLFKAFVQADVSTSRKYGGTGLGLTIAKNLIEAMRGRIELESQEGKGAVFSITFNLKMATIDRNWDRKLRSLPYKVIVYDKTVLAGQGMVKLLQQLGCQVMIVDQESALIDEIATHKDYDYILLIINKPPPPGGYYQSLIMDLKGFSRAKIILLANESEHQLAEYHKVALIDYVLPMPYRVGKLKAIFQDKADSGDELEEIAAPGSLTSDQSPHVLIIDDNPINLKLLKILLENANCRVIDKTNALDALEEARHHSFDLVLTDVQMPGMDGIEFIRNLRQSDSYKRVPVIAVTADTYSDNMQNLIRYGFDDVEVKPVNEQKIRDLLAKYLCDRQGINGVNKVAESDISMVSSQKLIDLESGSRLASGNHEFAMEMLMLLMAQLPGELEKIVDSYNRKDSQALLMLTHKLHGAASYCGTPVLKEALSLLEWRLKNGDLRNLFVIQAYERLVKIIKDTIEAYKKGNKEYERKNQ